MVCWRCVVASWGVELCWCLFVVLWMCRVALCSVALWCCSMLCCVVLRGGVCCFGELVRCCDWSSCIALCLDCVVLQWVFVSVLVLV